MKVFKFNRRRVWVNKLTGNLFITRYCQKTGWWFEIEPNIYAGYSSDGFIDNIKHKDLGPL